MANSKKNTEKKEAKPLDRNTGFLHISTQKTQESSPDYFGSMDINGELFQIGGWGKDKVEGKGRYIQLALRPDTIEINDWKGHQDDFVKQYQAEKKEKGKDMFITMNYTGNLHRSDGSDPEQDYYGTIRIDSEMIRVNALLLTGKEKPILRLKVSEGLSKWKREELSNEFL